MYSIRKSIFETNSSSTHSITIADSGHLKNTLECHDGIIFSSGGEFGWEEEEYTDAKTKLDYLVTAIFVKHFYPTKRGDKPKIHWDKIDKDHWVKLCKAVEDQTGCLLQIKPSDKDWYPIGYIDHQSAGVAEEVLNSTVGKIKRFIFNPNSVLRTGNDNDTCWEDYT